MASEKAAIAENVQKYLGKSDWKSAIAEMEKLFAIDQDPIIRVRIGDARQKMNQKAEAVKEYIHAADLYAEKGFVVKALAQYKLALRLDPANKDAQGRIELLHTNKSVSELKLEPIEDGALEPTRSVIPLFSDFTQEEFNEFTKRMIIHTMPPRQGHHQGRRYGKIGLHPHPGLRESRCDSHGQKGGARRSPGK